MLTQLNEDGQPLLCKTAGLMPDGEYGAKHSGSSPTTQARCICTNMKAAGIELYNVDDGDVLRSAFRDIALKISTRCIAE